jgi:hypothetical protein
MEVTVGTNWTGSRSEDPDEACSPDRPYGPRPYGPRPYGPRSDRPPPVPTPYGPRSDKPPPVWTPYGPRPYGPRPYGPRPYGPRPYGPRSEDGGCPLDAGEWGADIAELFCQDSAVIRMGARIVTEGDLSVLSTEPLEGTPGYVARPEETVPKDDAEANEIQLRAEKERAALAKRVLRPRHHELAVKVVIPDDLVRCLVDSPEIAWGLKQDIAHALAVDADRAFLQGDPPGSAPIGIRRTAAVNPNPPPANPDDLLQVARTMVGNIRRREQVRFGNAGWILHPYWVDALTRVLTGDFQEMGFGAALDSKQLLAPDGHDGGTLLGFPFISTSAARGDRDPAQGDPDDVDLSSAWIHFSADWSEAWIGVDPDVVTVNVSVDAHFQSDETVIRAVANHDFLVRRPKFFTYADIPNEPFDYDDNAGATFDGAVPPPPDAQPAQGDQSPEDG